MPGLRHIVLLDFGDAPASVVDAVVDALAELPPRLAGLRSYDIGRDAGLSTGNASLGVVADFDSADDWAAYRDDPEHQRIIAELIRPHLVGRAAVQAVLS